MPDLDAMADKMFSAMQGYVARAMAGVSSRMDAFDAAIKAIPHGPPGESGDRGDSVTVDDVLPLIRETIAVEVAALPPPKDGEDGKSVTVDELTPLVETVVAKAVSDIPKPQDGKSVTLEEVLPVLKEAVAAEVAAIPRPADGKDVDPQIVAEMVRATVADQVAQFQPIEPDPEVIDAAVAKAIAQIPPPKAGENGKDADPAVIKAEVEKAVAAIPKPKDGENVPLEVVVALVSGEVAKAVGTLPKAKDGDPGRDAAQIEPLPAIDEMKSYPRGTWAKHAGGLWLARAATDGMTGWDCMMEAVSGVVINPTDERNFGIEVRYSSGRVDRSAFSVPVMIYRGVWTAKDYEPGDSVTWGGSLWHCDEHTADKPGEVGSKGWTLATKRGRDGKDATAPKLVTLTQAEVRRMILEDIEQRGPIWRALEKDPPIK